MCIAGGNIKLGQRSLLNLNHCFTRMDRAFFFIIFYCKPIKMISGRGTHQTAQHLCLSNISRVSITARPEGFAELERSESIMPFSWPVQHWFHSRYTCITNLELGGDGEVLGGDKNIQKPNITRELWERCRTGSVDNGKPTTLLFFFYKTKKKIHFHSNQMGWCQ